MDLDVAVVIVLGVAVAVATSTSTAMTAAVHVDVDYSSNRAHFLDSHHKVAPRPQIRPELTKTTPSQHPL